MPARQSSQPKDRAFSSKVPTRPRRSPGTISGKLDDVGSIHVIATFTVPVYAFPPASEMAAAGTTNFAPPASVTVPPAEPEKFPTIIFGNSLMRTLCMRPTVVTNERLPVK